MKSPAAQFRRSAAALEKKIAKKRAPRKTNTRKRIRQWQSALADARKMELLQDRLLTLADLWQTDQLPRELCYVTQKQQVEYLLTVTKPDLVKGSPTGRMLADARITTLDQYNAARDALLSIGNPNAGKKRPETVIREKELALPKIDGFYPTPREIVEKMLSYTDIQPGDYVLEPSAGRGDIAAVIRDKHPQAIIHCVEWSASLREILELKGFKVLGDDIFEFHRAAHDPLYQWIVMNPPFEDGADAKHIQHVYDNFLAPGGVLCAITSAGVQFRQDYSDFRQWLDDHHGHSAALPPQSFADADVSTNVATRLLVVGKPDSSGNWPVIDWQEENYVEPDLWPGTWVQHEDGRKGQIKEVQDGKYIVDLEVTSRDLFNNPLKRQLIWHPAKVQKIQYLDVAYHWFHVLLLEMESAILGYINMRNLKLLGMGEPDLDTYILRWAAYRVDVARRIRKHWGENFSELFTADECRPHHHDGKEYETNYSRPPSPEELDRLVERGLLGCYADHYYITEAGVRVISDKKDWADYQPHIERALAVLQDKIFYAEVLQEAVAVLREDPITAAEASVSRFAVGDRVYVPHRRGAGTVRQIDTGITIMLESGVCIQTHPDNVEPLTDSRDTSPHTYNVESTKIPLNERSNSPAGDSRLRQLELF